MYIYQPLSTKQMDSRSIRVMEWLAYPALDHEVLALNSPRGTLHPLYNTVRYNTVLDITRFKDVSQKCIDYIEKWP